MNMKLLFTMPINNQLWHARVGLFSSRLNKQNETMFLSYLSNELSNREISNLTQGLVRVQLLSIVIAT